MQLMVNTALLFLHSLGLVYQNDLHSFKLRMSLKMPTYYIKSSLQEFHPRILERMMKASHGCFPQNFKNGVILDKPT